MKNPLMIILLLTVRITAAESTELEASPTKGLTLSITDTENRVWDVQYSTSLGSDWTSMGRVRVANSSLEVYLGMPGTAPTMFFRAKTLDDQTQISSPVDLLDITDYNYANPSLPAHLLTPQIITQDNTPVGNATTNTGAYLGRVLFFDKRLSANQTVSCSSCHVAEHGFSDPRQFSVGFEGGLTGRNSMGLTNNRYYVRGNYFWDERAATLEEQVLMPIQDSTEMGLTLPELVSRISAEPFYAELFSDAFGTPTVDTDRISRSLAQFVRSIVSGETKYDEGRRTNFSNFTAEENLGRRIFNGQNNGGGNATCSACHGTDNFVPGNFIRNNGLENPSIDQGLGAVTGQAQDNGRFKVPSLRNIELTAPYMHDGRFATLKEVVEFYDSGVVDHPNLAAQLREPPLPPGPGGPPPGPGDPLRLNLINAEKAALVAFLQTLTDTSIISDPKFGDPFLTDADLSQPTP